MFVFDLDNTLIDSSEREWDDLSRVPEDKVIQATAKIMDGLFDYEVIVLLTARKERHRGVTEGWLESNDIPYDILEMRNNADKRPDHEMKADRMERLQQRFNVRGAFEDDPKTAQAYRELGVTTFLVETK